MFVRLLTLLAVTATLLSRGAAPTEWNWVAPQPHRQSWMDLASGTNGFIALTEGYGRRQIYHSADGDEWELAQVPSNAGLKRLKFLNGHYFAIGNQETILTSPDGYDWQARNTNTSGSVLFDIAYGNGAYVAVGYNSVALWSKDLKIWSPVEFPKMFSLLNVEFGNGFFLAVANSGNVYKSADGRIWTASPWPQSSGFPDPARFDSGFAFNNGVFVLSGRDGTATSADGVNWTIICKSFFGRITATDSGFLGSGPAALAVSDDGANWDTRARLENSTAAPFYCAAKSGERWLAGGFNGLFYASTNGLDWSAVSQPIDYSRGNIAYANGRFIRYGSDNGQFVSSDGEIWSFNPNTPGLITVTGGNGVAVGITSENKAAVSIDGTNWQQLALPTQANGRLFFGNGKFIVAADGGAMLSADGKSWELVRISNIASLRLIGFQNGVFAAIGDASKPMTSTDGRAWTVGDTQFDATAQFYAAGNGRFVGIGGGGMGPGFVTWSTDGLHWQRERLSSGSTYSYTGLEFGGGYYVMVDGSGGIFYSTEGVNWLGERQAPQPFTGAAYGNGTWVVAGGDSILRSIDQLTAKSVVTLQLTQTNFSTWNLIVTGSVGERWQIQSASGINAKWETLQTVEITSAGRVVAPLALDQTAGFFRAVIQP